MLARKFQDIGPHQFRDLFLHDVPLMDVRAPVEFSAGAFPRAVNLPILDDTQRDAVGKEYMQHGQSAAVGLGNSLATPQLRQLRLEKWQEFIQREPNGYLYCFRGGLRSQITQQWLRASGFDYPLIKGGYKSLRRFLLNECRRLCEAGNILLLSGKTGVGKTEFICGHPSSLDLEGHARHRGSAFGKTFQAQPSQVDWENQVIIDWLKCEAASTSPVVIEAESRMIGKICVSEPLHQAMSVAPVIVLEAGLPERVERLLNDYVMQNLAHFRQTDPDPWSGFEANIAENLSRIKKRFGSQRYQELCGLLPDAVRCLRDAEDGSGFRHIIETLLGDYYDRLYGYNLEKNRAKVIFTGEQGDLKRWLANR